MVCDVIFILCKVGDSLEDLLDMLDIEGEAKLAADFLRRAIFLVRNP